MSELLEKVREDKEEKDFLEKHNFKKSIELSDEENNYIGEGDYKELEEK